MTEWTPESEEYLEGYLDRVAALARNQNDDPDDIVPELREHIVRETEDAAGSLVTIEHLRKTLAAVGTPEQVTGAEETPPAEPPASPRRRTGCWIAGIVLVLLSPVILIALAAALILFVRFTHTVGVEDRSNGHREEITGNENMRSSEVGAATAIPSAVPSRASANDAAAAGAMRTISTGQAAFQIAGIRDDDGDGVGDYGTLEELANPGGTGTVAPFIDSLLATGQKHGYVFGVTVTPGSATAQPAYTCTAVPAAAGRTGYRQYFVDESGIIRYTGDGTSVSADSPPLN